jgi:hypothetical protein
MTIYMRTIYEKEQGQELASELDAVVLGHGKVQAGHIGEPSGHELLPRLVILERPMCKEVLVDLFSYFWLKRMALRFKS